LILSSIYFKEYEVCYASDAPKWSAWVTIDGTNVNDLPKDWFDQSRW